MCTYYTITFAKSVLVQARGVRGGKNLAFLKEK
jgi:hypothetical protein